MSGKKKVISLEDIKEKAKGEVVEIPDWEPEKTINVRLRRIDVTPIMMESGSIPDDLSKEVATMMEKGEEIDPEKLDTGKFNPDNFIPVLNSIAKEALAEPTYEEINEVYPLTMNQKLAIFKFVTGGIEQLKPFREE